MADATLARVAVRLPPEPPRGTSPEYLRHQAVASLFRHAEGARPLFRVLHSRDREEQLLVLARAAPRRTDDIAPGRWIADVVSKPFAPELRPGQRLDFDVDVNATAVVSGDAGKRRRDVWDIRFADRPGPEVDRERVYAEWLERKLGRAAELLVAAIAERGAVHVRRRAGDGLLTFVRTRLRGSVVVREPDAFRDLLVEGIGRARAFGCGLLCVLPYGTWPRRA